MHEIDHKLNESTEMGEEKKVLQFKRTHLLNHKERSHPINFIVYEMEEKNKVNLSAEDKKVPNFDLNYYIALKSQNVHYNKLNELN